MLTGVVKLLFALIYFQVHFLKAGLACFLNAVFHPPRSFCYCFRVHLCYIFVDFSGIRSWDTNLTDCNLDQELKLFVSRHSARFSADVKGKHYHKMVGVFFMDLLIMEAFRCLNKKKPKFQILIH